MSTLKYICSLHFKTILRRSNSFCIKPNAPIYTIFTNFERFASSKAEGGKVAVPESKPKGGEVSTVTEKVKQAGKDVTYTAIVLVGLGVTGIMVYAIGRELFSSQSSSGVYGKALKDCKKNEQILSIFGEPIKGYGEMSSRGRRRHVSHSLYELDGKKHMRMKFYMEGPFKKGTVHLEVKENESGKYEYRYLFVELDEYPERTIVVEDNR